MAIILILFVVVFIITYKLTPLKEESYNEISREGFFEEFDLAYDFYADKSNLLKDSWAYGVDYRNTFVSATNKLKVCDDEELRDRFASFIELGYNKNVFGAGEYK